jgi:hypothetical protein
MNNPPTQKATPGSIVKFGSNGNFRSLPDKCPLQPCTPFALFYRLIFRSARVPKLGAKSKDESPRTGSWSVEPKEGVVFHTRFPQVFGRPVALHVESQDSIIILTLFKKQTCS